MYSTRNQCRKAFAFDKMKNIGEYKRINLGKGK